MNHSDAIPTYIARANALEYEAIWRLGADTLELQGGPTAGPDVVLRFPYRDVVSVRLSYAPSRADSVRYRCDLRLRSGQRLAILSTHYAGIANFEDRGATYVPFVRSLVDRVAVANPHASFRSGKSPIAYWAEHIFLLAMVAVLVVLLSAVGLSSIMGLVWVKLLIILGSIPLLLAYTRKNWPRRFKPDAIPSDVLPV
jgi:hypothetical protein